MGHDDSPSRQPQGTYYTPADVTEEMVKDALTAAVKDDVGALTEMQLLELFGDSDPPLPELSEASRERLAERIRELRIFDPAVGSGAFLFSALLAIRRSLKKLGGVDEPVEDIIRRQLRGQDINPLAIQIARLRLFIAIIWARRDSETALSVEDEALPNLEAVIVCADSLETVADPKWRSAQLDMADPDVRVAISEIGANGAQWFDAHTESEKRELQNKDRELRARLESLLHGKGELASAELRQFASTELLSRDPARTDARLLFYENPWRGFDIVIGNPPYEALSKTVSQDDRKRLANEKRYQTIKGGDLYNLFCETALALANPDGGVVTIIVPLSISFGQNKQSLRALFAQRSKSIALRHYNNRPDTIFNASPTVKTPENAQRATILTAVLDNKSKNKRIESTGLQGWHSADRQVCLRFRQLAKVPKLGPRMDKRIAGQWPRVPTREVSEMIRAIANQRNSIGDFRSQEGEVITFPKTPRYFLSTLPQRTVSPRSESVFTIESTIDLRLAIAVLNGHVSYGWWRVFGDGFHLNLYELTTFGIPDTWIDDSQAAVDIGQQLLAAIPQCLVENKQQGRTWRNVDFHTYAPDLIEKLDRLHIEALGLEVEPLLTHLKVMRSNSSWNYTV